MQDIISALEAVWPIKPDLRAVCERYNREESTAALVAVCRAHGVDEDCLREVVRQVLRSHPKV
jgi:hypothetical protein